MQLISKTSTRKHPFGRTIFVILGLASVLIVAQGCRHRSGASGFRSDGNGIDKSKFLEAKSSAEAFTIVSKRLLGLGPKNNDNHDHIGFLNLADMLGYKYPFNSCGASWVDSVNDKTGEVTLYAPHSNGANDDCREGNMSSVVHYGMRDWQVNASQLTELQPFQGTLSPNDWPRSSGAPAGTNVTREESKVEVVNGKMVVTTPEVVWVEGHNNSTDSQDLSLNYSRTINTTHMISKTYSTSNEVGVGISVTAEGGFPPFAKVSTALSTNYKFTIGNSATDTDSSAKITTVQCASSIKQKPGCSYRLKIVANYVQTKARYMSYLKIRPKTVTLQGALTDHRDCQHKQYRKNNGTCSAQNITETLGSDGGGFVRDLDNRLTGGDGNWYWQSLRSLDSQKQADGKLNIDILTDYISNGDYDQVSLAFDDVSESVTECKAYVEVLTGGDNCRMNDPGVSTSAN